MIPAIILAGGFGTRLREVVPNLPKPMAPIGGRPFLEHQLDYWIGQGVSKFVLSVGYRHETIMSHFGAAYCGVPLEYAVEKSPLGTGGGMLLAMEKFTDRQDFLLLNGDTYFEVDLRALREFHQAKGADWTFSLFHTSEDGRYMGLDVSSDGAITSPKSRAARPGRLANGGVYLLSTGVFRNAKWRAGDCLSLEDDILPELFLVGRRFCGFESAGTFIDIGVPEDYFRAPGLLAA